MSSHSRVESQHSWINVLWQTGDNTTPAPKDPHPETLYRPDILQTIEEAIYGLRDGLVALSLEIHAHPELGFEEHYAHAAYTKFMKKYGWHVREHHLLDTAWEATFEHGQRGRVIGVNSEMDALKGIGHACGHNLIGIAGVAISLGLRAAMEKYDIPGKIILLGTPAEEGLDGKVVLLEKGAYKGMDVCLMCHPAPGPLGSVNLGSSLARQRITVEYKGHAAHAALSPWEGKNALDAVVLAYNNISALRQQLKPTHRVHGIIEGTDWEAYTIPENAKLVTYVRAPTRTELQETVKRVLRCFHAASLATGCQIDIDIFGQTYDLRQNQALGDEVSRIMLNKYGSIDYEWGINSASTDFGTVTYNLPALHPSFSIPTIPNGGNHTRQFTEAAATTQAHEQCLVASIALAGTGLRVLTDDDFYAEVSLLAFNPARLQKVPKRVTLI
ncbi:hypothetical protein NP233_g5982 [Leucocoprinus birnbaumii]|uniref:Peptidase M20 domain-containing protein 2 n=1 Tax=Leucocoprinus birnbaumii TaxID=56174 RepID=A0AAD5VRX0_9AGAR|nr:hypothetical protein NP233_g5982 [Leucocoprinus birnbaumii]